VTEYRDTGHGSDGYPAREGGDPDRGGTLYGGGARHNRDEDLPSGQDERGYGDHSTYDDTQSQAHAVWRPPRGPRAEEGARGADPGYTAPERSWRTSDGGYRSADGGWRAVDGTGQAARSRRVAPDLDGAGRMPPDAGGSRVYPADTGETTRIPRQPSASSAGYPTVPLKRRAAEGGRSGSPDDSTELYSYDPLTLGGGESPAMRRPTRAADPRGYDGRAPDAGMYGSPARYQRERAPAAGEEMPARRPAERRYQEPPPVRRPPARPVQRFEGTYPAQSIHSPRNVVPPRGRPLPDDEDDADEAPGFVHTALVTTAWYTIPLLLYTMYVLTLDGSAQAGDSQSARQNALNGLLGGMPRVAVALMTSLAVALLIRVISRGWRAATIGFASAVVGAGVATVIFAALQG
jgi:hypothetical protein